MNIEKINKAFELNNELKYIMNCYSTYSYVSYLESIIPFFNNTNSSKKKNIEVIANEIYKIGYRINNCNEYKDLIIVLESIKTNIKIKVKEYMKSKAIDKTVENIIEKVFK